MTVEIDYFAGSTKQMSWRGPHLKTWMCLTYYDGLYSVPNKGHVTKAVLMRKAEIEAELVYVTLQWMEKDGVQVEGDIR